MTTSHKRKSWPNGKRPANTGTNIKTQCPECGDYIRGLADALIHNRRHRHW